MAYVKKYSTKEERSKALAEAARKAVKVRMANGNNRGGRPKGSRNKNPSLAIPTSQMCVRTPDYQVFVKCASLNKTTIVDFMHTLAEHLKIKNPDQFPAEPKIEL